MASAQRLALASCQSNCDAADAACMFQCSNTYGARTVCASDASGCPPGNTDCSVLAGKCVRVRNVPQQDWLQAFNAASSISEGIAVSCPDGAADCSLTGVSEDVLFASNASLDIGSAADYQAVLDSAAADVADFVASVSSCSAQQVECQGACDADNAVADDADLFTAMASAASKNICYASCATSFNACEAADPTDGTLTGSVDGVDIGSAEVANGDVLQCDGAGCEDYTA
jgi:hypothetical protein